MLDVIGAGATAKTDIDWHAIWISSRQYEEMQVELQDIIKRGEQSAGDETHDRKTHSLFPAPVKVQVSELMKRGYQNYFRNPPYLVSKYGTNIFAGGLVSFTRGLCHR